MGWHGIAVSSIILCALYGTWSVNALMGIDLVIGIFMRMAPFAKQNSCRLVLVNRRDYPGSLPYSEEELQPLMSAVLHEEESLEALSKLLAYTKARAQELHDFLCTFVQNEGILESSIVLVGWSLGSTWITQLLVHASSLSTGAVALRKYIRRVVWYGEWSLYFLDRPPTLTAQHC